MKMTMSYGTEQLDTVKVQSGSARNHGSSKKGKKYN